MSFSPGQSNQGGGSMQHEQENEGLWKSAGMLNDWSRALLRLSERGSSGLTVSQLAFFAVAAAENIAGHPKTQSQIIQMHGDCMSKAIRNTYRQLLPPSHAYPKAIGWLRKEDDPQDDRSKYLVLTEIGREVVKLVFASE
jgi:DNA-binding MarR family transcriptional regulator